MNTYNRMLSKLERAKSLKNSITNWDQDDLKLANPNDVTESIQEPESNNNPLASSQQQMDFSGLASNDLAELLQKECDTRLQLTDELEILRSKLKIKTLAVKDLESDLVSLKAIKEQFASELEKTKLELSEVEAELSVCEGQKSNAELSNLAAKKEIEKLTEELGTLKEQKLKSETENEQLAMEIGIMKENYQKLEVMFSDTSRHDKIQYENIAKKDEELRKVNEKLEVMATENETLKAVKLELEEQVDQFDNQLSEAQTKFEKMVQTAKEDLLRVTTRAEELEECRKVDTESFEKKIANMDTLLKAAEASKEKFEEEKQELEIKHNSNVKRLEEGFLATLLSRDEELEKYKILSNKYKKKNESLSKDIRNLLSKLESQKRAPSPNTPTLPRSSSLGSDTLTTRAAKKKTLVLSQHSKSASKLKDRLGIANEWRKQLKIRKKGVEQKPSRPAQMKLRRCSGIEKLNRSQLVAKCLSLQIANGDLTLQIETYNEQVNNLKFASSYLGKRVSALESKLDLAPEEDVPSKDGSRAEDLRAVLKAENWNGEETVEDTATSKQVESLKLPSSEGDLDSKKAEIYLSSNDNKQPPQTRVEETSKVRASMPVTKELENEDWDKIASEDEDNYIAVQKSSQAKEPDVELNFEDWLDS